MLVLGYGPFALMPSASAQVALPSRGACDNAAASAGV